MERVTIVRLKNVDGNPKKFFHFHHWYVEVGTGLVCHFDHRMATDENFDNTEENERFSDNNPYMDGDGDRFKEDVLNQEKFLKEACGSLNRAFRMYNNPKGY